MGSRRSAAPDAEVVSHLVRVSSRADGLAELTPRERNFPTLMAEGRSSTGTATALVVTPGVMEKHVATSSAEPAVLRS